MDKIIQPANPVIGVGYGQTATLDLQIGPRYHAICLEVMAEAAADVTIGLADVLGLINIKINGKVQRAHTAVELDEIQTSYGSKYAHNVYDIEGGTTPLWTSRTARTGATNAHKTMVQLKIYLAEPWRKSYAATESMAWYTAWADGSVLKSLQLEIAIPAAGVNVLANSAISINAWTETDNAIGPVDASKNPVALINKFKRTAIPYTGSGELPIVTLEKRHICNQISIWTPQCADTTYDTISAVKIKKDNATIREVTRVRNDESLIGREFNEAGLYQNRFDVVFDYSDLPTDGLVLEGARDFQLIPTIALSGVGAASKLLTLISQIYGPID